MNEYTRLTSELRRDPRKWLVTGAAGFIGSNLVQELLKLGQTVVGLDNYSTGQHENLEEISELVTSEAWARFTMIEGDVRDYPVCCSAVSGVDYVLHEAAMASVPQSIEDPDLCHEVNVTGFLNLLRAAKSAQVRRVVYASSCAVYGDDPALPKTEASPVMTLSPYALSKRMDELYADLWSRCYQLETIGLRYFNVFGPRQDPEGAYAAVISKWIDALLQNREVAIYGDGESTRDFCYIANVVQANILAATSPNPEAVNQVYNIGTSSRTSLNTLCTVLQNRMLQANPKLHPQPPLHHPFRAGDIRHSEADISKAQTLLGYCPDRSFEEGLATTIEWYLAHLSTIS